MQGRGRYRMSTKNGIDSLKMLMQYELCLSDANIPSDVPANVREKITVISAASGDPDWTNVM